MFPLQEHVPAWLMLQLVLRLSIILVLNLQQLLFSLKNIISDSEEMSPLPYFTISQWLIQLYRHLLGMPPDKSPWEGALGKSRCLHCSYTPPYATVNYNWRKNTGTDLIFSLIWYGCPYLM